MNEVKKNMSENGLLSCRFPGGNILIEREEGDRLWVSPDFRHMQEGHKWFYWSFETENRTPRTVVFSHQNYLSKRGPAMSRDRGKTWRWLGREIVHERQVSEHEWEYSFEMPPVPAGEVVRYAFCPQYQESHLREWADRHRCDPEFEMGELCKSRHGRAVEFIRIADRKESSDRKTIFLMARNHSCEAMASYVLEGLMEAALGRDALGTGLRRNREILAVPFMDKDGVEEGDQGKLRHPHDHNRDYNPNPIYPEVAAVMRIGETNRDTMGVFLDLHCPMVHGPWCNRFYLVGSPVAGAVPGQERFMKTFQGLREGPILAFADPVLHFGTAWNTGNNFSAGLCAANWAAEAFPAAVLVGAFEVPYANAEGVEVNPESARLLGRDLAAALLSHLES